MPAIPLHLTGASASNPSAAHSRHNPLPPLLHTPTGLAILEIQGTIKNIDMASSSQSPSTDHSNEPVPPPPPAEDAGETSAEQKEAVRTRTRTRAQTQTQTQTPIGRLIFPDYRHTTSKSETNITRSAGGHDDTWMKRVYLYIGKHQRLTGEVRKLARPVGVVCKRRRRRSKGGTSFDASTGDVGRGEDGKSGEIWKEGGEDDDDDDDDDDDELDVIEVVKWKVIFKNRPEPVAGE